MFLQTGRLCQMTPRGGRRVGPELAPSWSLCCSDALKWGFTCARRVRAPWHPPVGGPWGRNGSLSCCCLCSAPVLTTSATLSCYFLGLQVSIGSPEKMEPITKVSHIPSSRWALVCSLCNEKFGASIQVTSLVRMALLPFLVFQGAGRGRAL